MKTLAVLALMLASTQAAPPPVGALGLNLNQSIPFVECPKEEGRYTLIRMDTNCWMQKPGILSSVFDVRLSDVNWNRLPFLRSGIIVSVIDGKIESIVMTTIGLEGQADAYQLLVERFGKPTTTQAVPMQNLAGGTFPVRDAVWRFPNGVVRFVGAGDGGRLDYGKIEINSILFDQAPAPRKLGRF